MGFHPGSGNWNTAAIWDPVIVPNAISATFANLPDGAILSVNVNSLKASYEGGDGNDLTLTAQ